MVEAGVARRGLAVACYLAGDFLEARIHCEQALAASDPEREKETRERFTDDTGPVVMSVLAMTMWQLGEVQRARELIDEGNQRARDLGHAPSMAHPLNWDPLSKSCAVTPLRLCSARPRNWRLSAGSMGCHFGASTPN